MMSSTSVDDRPSWEMKLMMEVIFVHPFQADLGGVLSTKLNRSIYHVKLLIPDAKLKILIAVSHYSKRVSRANRLKIRREISQILNSSGSILYL